MKRKQMDQQSNNNPASKVRELEEEIKVLKSMYDIERKKRMALEAKLVSIKNFVSHQ